MSAEISIQDVSLRFRLYHDKGGTLKQTFSTLLRKRHHTTYSDFWALRGVNLHICHGERIGIVGRNGAGKSSLLKTICRVYKPTTGHVSVQGSIAPLIEVGAGFHPELTGRENIYLNAIILGQHPDDVARMEPEIVRFSGIEEFIDTPVKYYSTGMYMRLAFSVATAITADTLILDEMFVGGDAEFVNRGFARLQSFIEKAKIIVCVSHQIDFLRDLCTRIIWLDHGTVKADGPTDQVLDQYLAEGRQPA